MKKANDPHPVHCVLRNWSREPAPVFAIKHERKDKQLIEAQSALRLMNKAKEIPTVSTLPYKVVNSKCARQVYILPH